MNGLDSLAAAASILDEFDGNEKVANVLNQNMKKKFSHESMGGQQEQLPKRRKYTRTSPPQSKILGSSVASLETTFNEDILFRENVSHDNRAEPKIRKLSNYFSQPSRLWCTHEWFYSTLDRDYYNENEFKGCLQILNIDEVHSLTRTEWSAVRGVMSSYIGRPRRFSTSFLEGERQKLNEYRKKSRNVQRGIELPDAVDFPYQVFTPIKVGDIVTMHDHSSNMLRRGKILTIIPTNSREPLYRVQFSKAEVSTSLCWDLDLALHGSPEIILCRRRPGDVEDIMLVSQPANIKETLGQISTYPLHQPSSIVPDDELDEERNNHILNIALLTQMLDRKERFIGALRSINQCTEEALFRRSVAGKAFTSPPAPFPFPTTTSTSKQTHTPNTAPIKMENILSSASKRKATLTTHIKKQCSWVVTNICAADIAVETSLRNVRDAVITQTYQETMKYQPSSAVSISDKGSTATTQVSYVSTSKPTTTSTVDRKIEDEDDDEEEEEEEIVDEEVIDTQLMQKILLEWKSLLPKAKAKIKSSLVSQQSIVSNWIESTPTNSNKIATSSNNSNINKLTSNNNQFSEYSSNSTIYNGNTNTGTNTATSSGKRSFSASGINTSTNSQDNKNNYSNNNNNNGNSEKENFNDNSFHSSSSSLYGMINNEQLSVELIEHCIAFLLLIRRLHKVLPDFDVHTLLQPRVISKLLPFTCREGIHSSELLILLKKLIY